MLFLPSKNPFRTGVSSVNRIYLSCSEFTDSLSHWKSKTQTRFLEFKMCVFEKKKGQKTAFHACTSSAKWNSKFGKCFSSKSKLNRNLIRFGFWDIFFGESMFHETSINHSGDSRKVSTQGKRAKSRAGPLLAPAPGVFRRTLNVEERSGSPINHSQFYSALTS